MSLFQFIFHNLSSLYIISTAILCVGLAAMFSYFLTFKKDKKTNQLASSVDSKTEITSKDHSPQNNKKELSDLFLDSTDDREESLGTSILYQKQPNEEATPTPSSEEKNLIHSSDNYAEQNVDSEITDSKTSIAPDTTILEEHNETKPVEETPVINTTTENHTVVIDESKENENVSNSNTDKEAPFSTSILHQNHPTEENISLSLSNENNLFYSSNYSEQNINSQATTSETSISPDTTTLEEHNETEPVEETSIINKITKDHTLVKDNTLVIDKAKKNIASSNIHIYEETNKFNKSVQDESDDINHQKENSLTEQSIKTETAPSHSKEMLNKDQESMNIFEDLQNENESEIDDEMEGISTILYQAPIISTSESETKTEVKEVPKPIEPEPVIKPTEPKPAPQPKEPEPAPQPKEPEPAPQPKEPEPAPQPKEPEPVAQPTEPKPVVKPVDFTPIAEVKSDTHTGSSVTINRHEEGQRNVDNELPGTSADLFKMLSQATENYPMLVYMNITSNDIPSSYKLSDIYSNRQFISRLQYYLGKNNFKEQATDLFGREVNHVLTSNFSANNHLAKNTKFLISEDGLAINYDIEKRSFVLIDTFLPQNNRIVVNVEENTNLLYMNYCGQVFYFKYQDGKLLPLNQKQDEASLFKCEMRGQTVAIKSNQGFIMVGNENQIAIIPESGQATQFCICVI